MACGCFINTAKNNETYQILIGFFWKNYEKEDLLNDLLSALK